MSDTKWSREIDRVAIWYGAAWLVILGVLGLLTWLFR